MIYLVMDILQLIDSKVLQEAFPETLWFVVAVLSIAAFLYMFNRYILNQEVMIKELKQMSLDHEVTLGVQNNRLTNVENDVEKMQDTIYNVRYPK